MTDWPPICVLFLTFNRFSYAESTLTHILTGLSYSGHWGIHIADDGSSEEYRDDLRAIVGDRFQGMTNSQRGGYGQNYNLALQNVHQWAELILPLEDDWELLRPFSLDNLVLALLEGQFGCIRMGYIGWTQELRGKFLAVAGQTFLGLDPDSPEPHIWAGHPRLETREWQRRLGPWPEDPQLDPGSTEFVVAQRPAARDGVVWPIDLIHPRGDLFAHAGSIQARTDQRQEVSAV